MSLFENFKEDFSQAMNELLSNENAGTKEAANTAERGLEEALPKEVGREPEAKPLETGKIAEEKAAKPEAETQATDKETIKQ